MKVGLAAAVFVCSLLAWPAGVMGKKHSPAPDAAKATPPE